jgi:hypothetical protein
MTLLNTSEVLLTMKMARQNTSEVLIQEKTVRQNTSEVFDNAKMTFFRV